VRTAGLYARRQHPSWLNDLPLTSAQPSLRTPHDTLQGHVRRFVLPGSTIFTDEWTPYVGLDHGYHHRRIRHSENVYVSGDVHTQTIEGFFSNLKRGISGNYHSVSSKWLQGYLNEYAWRYNHRDDEEAMFETLIVRAAQPDL
jgi:transposase